MINKQSIYTFCKAQFSAFTGGMFDYAVMIFCVEFFNIHYTKSILISGLLGALVNFSINKYWTYQAKGAGLRKQLMKFYLVVLGSIALKSFGTYLFTENLRIDYKISRLLIDLFVSIGFNYMLQKHWVFKKEKSYELETARDYREA